VSVTLCTVIRFTSFDLHKVLDSHPSYSLRTGSAGTDGHDVYGVIGSVPSIVVFGVGRQLPRWPLMTRRPNGGASGVISFSFEVRACQGRLSLPCKSLRGIRAPNMSSPHRSVRPEYSMSIIQSIFHLELHIVGVKTRSVYLSTNREPVLGYSTCPGPGLSGLSL